MDTTHLFQSGTTDLGSGTAQAEDFQSSVFTQQNTSKQPLCMGSTAVAAIDPALQGNTDADHFIRRDGRVFAGTHLIIEVIEGQGLDDEQRIQQAFRDCVQACGATLLHIHTHKFSPQGVSGVAVLAESHISVHTWPERGYAAFDVFMCGDSQPMKAVAVLRAAFKAGDVHVKEILRGEGLVGA